jgi:hypothetical protein
LMRSPERDCARLCLNLGAANVKALTWPPRFACRSTADSEVHACQREPSVRQVPPGFGTKREGHEWM